MIKKSIIAMCLIFANLNADGIPTFDMTSLQQQIKAYAQQIKEYEQMVKDTLNFEKQMAEFGVDMNDVKEILGETQELINSMQGIYNEITGIPKDIFQSVAEVEMACDFLANNSQGFKNSLNNITKIVDKFNRCTASIRNGVEISKTIDELEKTLNKTLDYTEYMAIKMKIDNLKKAQEYVTQKENEEQANKILAFYDSYHKNDKNNPYTKEHMQKDLETLSKQLNKPNNQKQAQALTNAILIKMLENMQRQYELNIEYANTLTTLNLNNTNGVYGKKINKNDFLKDYETMQVDEELLGYTHKKVKTDDFGLPIFTLKD